MKELIRKTIGGKALLDYQENPAFISFRLLSIQGASQAVKKLCAAGFPASRPEQSWVKIDL